MKNEWGNSFVCLKPMGNSLHKEMINWKVVISNALI